MLTLHRLCVLFLLIAFRAYPALSAVDNSKHQASLQGSTQPWTETCLPFDQAAVAQANLTAKELATLPELCYRPDLLPNLFLGTDSDRGIPPGVHCTPTKWYTQLPRT